MVHLTRMMLATALVALAQEEIESITVVPPSPQVGAPITSLTVTMKDKPGIHHEFSTGMSLIVIAHGERVFITGANPTYTLTYGGVDIGANMTVEAISATSLKISGGEDTVGTTPASSYVLTVTDNLVPPQVQDMTVNFEVSFGTTKTLQKQGWKTVAASVVSDPLTFFNGTKTKFWIPHDTYTTLLLTPDTHILAKPLVGPGNLQWFESFKMLWNGQDTLADVCVVHGQDLSSIHHGFVGEQVAVNMSESLLKIGGGYPEMDFVTADGSFRSIVRKNPYYAARTHGKNEVEYVCFESPSITFCIYASHAGNEFPNDVEMQKKYVHLDFSIVSSMRPLSEYTGILPEIWGVINISESTQAMLKPPSSSVAPTVCTAQ